VGRRWRWMPWLHLPAAAYGAAIELVGWICPLTPLALGHRPFTAVTGVRVP
ncbi:MAG: DUF2784 family protein, partial [Ketobacteraceae bacterium]|nr:DUF2784 family protein [Ketobacteraceae bacterium]